MSTVTVEGLKLGELVKPRVLVYLPGEGLQGEEIPSYVLWENLKVKSIRIDFHPPLAIKGVFNVASFEEKEGAIIAKGFEVGEYLGLSFTSQKVEDKEVRLPVEFDLELENGEIRKEMKSVTLFRPQIGVTSPRQSKIAFDSRTHFVRGRIRIRNIGRGVMLTKIVSADDSPIQIETPPEHVEYAEKINANIEEELGKVADGFPLFRPYWEQMLIWSEKDPIELNPEEREKLLIFFNDLGKVLAGNKKLLLSFVEAYAKALARNIEIIERIKLMIKLYETSVTMNILLTNPFDEVVLTKEKEFLVLKIEHTDSVLNKYDDVMLKVEVSGEPGAKIPLYQLFEWG